MIPKRIFLLAGEASGDLHASNLIKEMKAIDPSVVFFGWGGDKMKNAGVQVLKELKDLSFMGFLEILFNLGKINKNFRDCKEQILRNEIDTIILVDYPGFNLRMAKWSKLRGIKVIYYISPQIWAWKKNRIFTIKKYVDAMYCILPFEVEFYKEFKYDAHYFGHPLLDEIKKFHKENTETLFTSQRPILAILPGSRKQEIERKLPVMLEAAKKLKSYSIYVACAPNLSQSVFQKYQSEEVHFVKNQTYALLTVAKVAIVTSGTATLETALFKVPQVVCYKSSAVSYFIAKQLIKVKFISLVNLILDKRVVSELIQYECTSEKIYDELVKILPGGSETKKMLEEYTKLIQLLGESGASKRIAAHLLN
ncbi:MAG: lipid-A-disaccharide synthase [Bacteroidetes bacterium]|nr:lipid-A-disaccharide synthase [Bacteroidota bacterium]